MGGISNITTQWIYHRISNTLELHSSSDKKSKSLYFSAQFSGKLILISLQRKLYIIEAGAESLETNELHQTNRDMISLILKAWLVFVKMKKKGVIIMKRDNSQRKFKQRACNNFRLLRLYVCCKQCPDSEINPLDQPTNSFSIEIHAQWQRCGKVRDICWRK